MFSCGTIRPNHPSLWVGDMAEEGPKLEVAITAFANPASVSGHDP